MNAGIYKQGDLNGPAVQNQFSSANEIIQESEMLSPLTAHYDAVFKIRNQQYVKLVNIELDNVDLEWVDTSLQTFICKHLQTLKESETFAVEVKRKVTKDV